MRMWSVATDSQEWLSALGKASTSLKENTPMAVSPDSASEENSGVECPGNKSLEPYIGTLLTVEEKTFVDEAILIEVAAGPFAFKYTKQERVFFGKCEWCTKNRLLNVVCTCKRVRYCDDQCMENDKRWHTPKCSSLCDAELN